MYMNYMVYMFLYVGSKFLNIKPHLFIIYLSVLIACTIFDVYNVMVTSVDLKFEQKQSLKERGSSPPSRSHLLEIQVSF